jgi:hypothetical protein
MAENTKRSLFGLHGVTGILIATVLLVLISVALTLMVIVTQRHAVENPYDPSVIRDINNIKMFSTENKNFAFQKKDKE